MREWLFEARKAKGLTQLEVAKKLDISEQYYCFIEKGERQKRMDLALASRLSAIFGISVKRIVEMEKEWREQKKGET